MMFTSLSLTLFLFWMTTPVDLTVVSLPPRGSVELALLATGKAEIARSGTLSRVKIEIDRVIPAGTLGPGLNTYVAWAVSPEGEFDNIGELGVTDAKVRFEGLTSFDQLAVLVTAEPHYMVDMPGAAVAYRNLPPREQGVRRTAVTVQLGVYDYSGLKAAPPAGLSLASQARTAFEIARAAGADRLAESELRIARVALDTMEEMLNRAAPAEILFLPANEAIRRSQRAFRIAREAAVRNELEAARSEAAGLNRDRQQLTSRVEELTLQQTATNDRARKLETDAVQAARENRELAEERTQAQARIQAIERELEELRRKQAEEKPASIRIPDEYIDPSTRALTMAGREALGKIASTANLSNGPMLIEVSANASDAVKKFFVDAGLPEGRVLFVLY